MHEADTGPLILTRDADLRAELERLCAAAALAPDVVHHPELARRPWSTARCVLVGADCAADVAVLELARRSQVVLVSSGSETPDVWRLGLAIRADHVAFLPDGQQWLVDWLIEARDQGSGQGITAGVIGGRGGAGSSTFAVALGQAAVARAWDVVLLDADPLGGGLELIAGCEGAQGLRWPDVVVARGRVSAAALRAALPSSNGLAVLSSGSGSPELHDVLDVVPAARRGADLVVVDLPRRVDAPMHEVVSTLDTLIVVTTSEVRAAAGAGQVIAALLPWCADIRVAVRTTPATLLPAHDIAASLGVPLAGVVSTRRSTQRSIDEGLGPTLSARDRRCLRELLESMQRRRSVSRR
jgi:secretion/DNA translocation related CpaE-like protein